MMKNLILITFIFTYVSNFFNPQPTNIRPPGTTKIVDNFYFDETEIRNDDWKEYLADLKKVHGKDSPIYNNALPDTSVWNVDGKNNRPFVVTYFQHPSYNDYPVVGISHEQATAYCIWRTKVVKQNMKNNGHGEVNFDYRLPTQTEWELVARAGYSDKQNKIIKKQNKKYNTKWRLNNLLHNNESVEVKMITPCRTYLPNKYGMFQLYGNVAEMVTEPNLAMGGSFLDKYDDVVPSNKSLTYDGPKRWLGFRCVAEFYD